MKLFYSPGACSQSPHIALREAGLAFDLVKVDLRAKKTDGGDDFSAINPKGYVPALLLDNGQLLTEGPAIVQYIADQNPESALAPKNGTLERYRLQEWLNFISTELHKSFSPLFNPDMVEAGKAVYRARLLDRFKWVDAQLEAKPYTMGENFSVADAYLFVVSGWGQYVGVDLSGLKNLQAFLGRVAARPAVQEAMKAEGLLK